MEETVKKIVADFLKNETVIAIEKLKSGLINSTYLVETSGGKYILQKMNQKVFPNIQALINNKAKITSFLKANNFKTIEFLSSKNGKWYTEDGDDIWQLSKFIPSTVQFRIPSAGVAEMVGDYLAKFHEALLDFPVKELGYTIPDFHNTIKRYNDFLKSIETATLERKEIAKDSIAFFQNNFHIIEKVANDINNEIIPLRVTHNDTKIGNMLFDEKGDILCIIDFDTIMPGSIFHDLGDTLRTGANTSTEEEKDLSKVCLDIEIYKAVMNGYIKKGNDFMTKEEKDNIQLSLPLLLFEQGCRFLSDYLNNDVYYDTIYESQNLVRAKTQIKLFEEIIKYQEKYPR